MNMSSLQAPSIRRSARQNNLQILGPLGDNGRFLGGFADDPPVPLSAVETETLSPSMESVVTSPARVCTAFLVPRFCYFVHTF
jgi:hypothetical protein